jgi:hypothetical protein
MTAINKKTSTGPAEGKVSVAAAGNKADAADKSGVWCWIAIVVVLIAAGAIRGRLLAIPFERDEGEYAYIAQQMLQGVPPYESAYSMKLPGIYAVYAVIMSVFGQTQSAVHLGLLIVNAATILVIFLLAKNLFGPLAAVASGCAYAITSLATQVTGLMANAEHFVVLPVLLGILLVYKAENKQRYIRTLAAGLLLGLAFIIKQHGVFFAVFAALYVLYNGLRHRPIQWVSVIITEVVFAAGAIAPFALVCFFFRFRGTFDKFWFWTFTYAREYAAAVPLSDAWGIFNEQIRLTVKESPIIWFLALAGLLSVFVIRRYRQWALFTIGLLLFSFLAVCPGFYFRGHYFIFVLPAVAILAGIGFVSLSRLLLFLKRLSVLDRTIITGAIGLAVAGFSLYQQREYLFYNSPDEVCRMIYTGNPFPESIEISKFIRENSRPEDTVAILGSEPQIYFYSHRRAATHYIYMYPLMEAHKYAKEMQKEMIGEIESAKPEFLVFVNVSTSWLGRPESVQQIFKWFESYNEQYYYPAGVADIFFTNGGTIYRWNRQAEEYRPRSLLWVAVFKRQH